MISYDVTGSCDPYFNRYAVFNDDGSLAELKVCNITNVSHETLTVENIAWFDSSQSTHQSFIHTIIILTDLLCKATNLSMFCPLKCLQAVVY